MASRIIVALDGMTREKALGLAKQLSGSVWGFKVNDLLLDEGLRIVSELKNYGCVFADPKLHDIPNTVANGVKKLVSAGADLITCHASGGRRMLEAAADASQEATILAVTALTSLGADDVKDIYEKSIEDTVQAFAALAQKAGVQGIVCSPKELGLFTGELADLVKVTPGVRPLWHVKKDDQSRVTTPAEAVKKGATYLVVGRPIIEHEDPREAVRLINEELL